MSSVNKVILIGRLGSDVEIFEGNNYKFAKVSVATSESWKDKKTDEWKEATEWHKCKASMGQMPEKMKENLVKGDLVYIEGSLRTNKFTNKDSQEVSQTEILINYYKKLSNASGSTRSSGSPSASTPSTSTPRVDTPSENEGDDDLPF